MEGIQNVLPEVKMEYSLPNENEEKTVDEIMAVNDDETIDVDNEEVEDHNDEEEEEMPVIRPRERVDTREVFSSHRNRYEEEEEQPSELKMKKPKRKMSDKQKANLAKARAIAAENRRVRKEAAERGEPIMTPKEKKAKKQMEEIAEKIPQTVNITNNITKEDIEEISKKASSQAILRYDEERKKRKAEKAEKLKKEKEQASIQKTIRQATGRAYGSEGFFSDCF